MAYDEQFAARVRSILQEEAGFDEKKMFGGIAFMLDGNMACGVMQDGLMVRVGPEEYEQALLQPGARPFDMGSKRMKAWVAVDESSLEEDSDLESWVQAGIDYSRTFPPK